MHKYTVLSLLFLFPFSLFASSENTDLIAVDGTKIVAPEFSYHSFSSCQEFQDVMQEILPKQNSWYRGGIMYDAVAPAAVSAKAE
jgi:hypothetical protein